MAAVAKDKPSRELKKIKPYKLYILIDTNIFFTDFLLSGLQFTALKNMLNKTGSILVVPKIVRLEVEKKFREQIESDVSSIERLQGKYPDAIELKKTGEELFKLFQEQWQKYMRAGWNITSTGHEKLSINSLVDRSIDEKPPFGKKSKGFRDAVIWESALAFLADKKDDCAFALISNNSNDFGGDKLKDELYKEIEALGRKAYYYHDLGAFLKIHGEKFDFLTDELVEEWVEGERNYLEDVAEDTWSFDVDRYNLDYNYSEAEDIELEETELDDYNIYSYYVYAEDATSYHIVVEVELNVYGYVSFRIPVDPWDRDEWDSPHWIGEHQSVGLNTSVELEFIVDKKTKEHKLL